MEQRRQRFWFSQTELHQICLQPHMTCMSCSNCPITPLWFFCRNKSASFSLLIVSYFLMRKKMFWPFFPASVLQLQDHRDQYFQTYGYPFLIVFSGIRWICVYSINCRWGVASSCPPLLRILSCSGEVIPSVQRGPQPSENTHFYSFVLDVANTLPINHSLMCPWSHQYIATFDQPDVTGEKKRCPPSSTGWVTLSALYIWRQSDTF